MNALMSTLHAALLLTLPILVVGVVNRVKSLWAGRVGPPLHQTAFDLLRLLRKRTVSSRTASWFVQAGPIVLLGSTLVAGALTPLVNGYAPFAFPYDLVVVAYLFGLGRLLLVLSAMDTGSAFEGMGASREVQYSAFVEPTFFLVFGALAALTGKTSFAQLLPAVELDLVGLVARLGACLALFMVLQVEAARVPIDDPSTHLELTMVHEVMILDHSGPDLAFVQYAAAMKLTLCAALVAGTLNPLSWTASPVAATVTSLLLLFLVAALVGLVESLVARLRLSAIPRYLLVGIVTGLLVLGTVFLAQRGPA